MKTVVTPIQMRFNDLDGFAHVNNSVYNQYLDCGRVDYIKQVFGTAFLFGNQTMVIVRIENDFLSPSNLLDELEVHTNLVEIGEKSVSMRQQIINKQGDIKVESLSVMSTFDIKGQCSFPFPDEWKLAIEHFQNS